MDDDGEDDDNDDNLGNQRALVTLAGTAQEAWQC